jgi:hypothetical protein
VGGRRGQQGTSRPRRRRPTLNSLVTRTDCFFLGEGKEEEESGQITTTTIQLLVAAFPQPLVNRNILSKSRKNATANHSPKVTQPSQSTQYNENQTLISTYFMLNRLRLFFTHQNFTYSHFYAIFSLKTMRMMISGKYDKNTYITHTHTLRLL